MKYLPYPGPWPGNVAKTAKYSVRFRKEEWSVCVLYEAPDGIQYLAVEGGAHEVAQAVNDVKVCMGDKEGGIFYVNEYRHILVPVSSVQDGDTVTIYYCAGKLTRDFEFQYHGGTLTAQAVNEQGNPLRPGDEWVGPRPGIPYVLAAGGGDIYYTNPVVSDADPPKLIPDAKKKVKLSKLLRPLERVRQAVDPVKSIRGHNGGRFYVNETCAIFTPQTPSEDGIHYVYCGPLDLANWFPEPDCGGPHLSARP